jgi:pimeloyl-ACP methyl ester carboxylesterase/DNA-binding winged helix-turn-helix (wHTH) protein
MIFVFDDCEIDCNRRQLRRAGVATHVEPQVFDVLVHLVRHRERVVSKDELMQEVWGGRIVSEDTITARISSARRAIGDTGDRQKLIRTLARRGFGFIGDVSERVDSKDVSGIRREPAGGNAAPQQEVTFCRTPDGVHLAVATVGGGPLLVKTSNWLTHLEFDWQSPVWSPLFRQLAAQCRLVRYDQRGGGLSDWEVPDFSFESYIRDLETVVDSLGIERFALMGLSQGAAISIAYAVKHPERVSKLILCGGFVKGWRKRGDASEIARTEASITLIREGWGLDNPMARQMFTSMIVPGATIEEMRWFNDLQRITTSPENAIRMLREIGDIDITDLLRRLAAPALVMHSREDARVPYEHGLALARAIPNARFVALESKNHLILSHEPAWPHFVREISAVLDAGEESTAGLKPASVNGISP